MIEIENLAGDQTPPEGVDYILVVGTTKGTYVHVESKIVDYSDTAPDSGPYASVEVALSFARARAELLHLPVVYARGLPAAEVS